ncbi:hypothetical protein AVEN_28294-1, partial [Araneus ventricosus]
YWQWHCFVQVERGMLRIVESRDGVSQNFERVEKRLELTFSVKIRTREYLGDLSEIDEEENDFGLATIHRNLEMA